MKNFKIANRLFIFTLALFCFALTAHAQSTAQRTFVSTSGNDANTASLCSSANPCRSFGAALGVTSTNGEIVALTSGGYGAVMIDKGVQITAPTGVYAAISALSGDAITVNASGATVVLRGLTLNSLGAATNGINVAAVRSLYIEGCIVNGFRNNGILISLTADLSEIYIKDTIVRNNSISGAGSGILITTTTGTVKASISGCHLENNLNAGIRASNRSQVTVSNSVASGNAVGFSAFSDEAGVASQLTADQCVASFNNIFGFSAQGNNNGTATIRVARSTATNNSSYGFAQGTGGAFISLGDNLVYGNGSSGMSDVAGTITIVSGR